MPYEVRKKGSKHCVYKKGTDKEFGCHPSRSKALAQLRALYANDTNAGELSLVAGAGVGEPVFDWEVKAVADSPVPLVTIPDVPIVSTGIEYMLSTGPHTFTMEELSDCVLAVEDPAIINPRLGIGHTDERFAGDGEPAIGKVVNLRLGNEGHTVYGDYVGVPGWLGEIMPMVYPSRSIEASINATTVTGRKYAMVLKAVKLLGITWPGVSTLDDLKMLYAKDGPEGLEIAASEATVALNASLDVEAVRKAAYEEVLTTESGRGMWWVRAMCLNPTELIVDGNDGEIYRLPFTVGEDDAVAFGDLSQVKIVYQDVPKSADEKKSVAYAAASGLIAARGEVAASFKSRAESRPDASDQKGGSVDLSKLRAKLGLPDTATDEEILAAAEGAVPEGGTGEEGTGDGSSETGTGDGGTGSAGGTGSSEEEEDEDSTGTTGNASGTVQVDAATWEEVRRGALRGNELAAKADREDRDNTISAAVQDGKFPPARAEHWRGLWDADPDGTRETIKNLAAGLIPVKQRGGQPNLEQVDASSLDAQDADIFPELKSSTRKGRAVEVGA
jgi:hypothetical protein